MEKQRITVNVAGRTWTLTSSDPPEHVRRVEELGYSAVAITDHADASNIGLILPNLIRAAKQLNRANRTRLIVGVELTHVPPPQIADLVAE